MLLLSKCCPSINQPCCYKVSDLREIGTFQVADQYIFTVVYANDFISILNLYNFCAVGYHVYFTHIFIASDRSQNPKFMSFHAWLAVYLLVHASVKFCCQWSAVEKLNIHVKFYYLNQFLAKLSK